MIKKIRLILTSILLFSSMILSPAAFADTALNKEACAVADDVQKAALGCDETRELVPTFQKIINVAITVVGLVAVFIIVMGGQKYITASGDPAKATVAKNMIIWGVVGLVIAVLASAIVRFIVSAVS